MRQGCISLGEVSCGGCRRAIPYPERYLLIREKDGVEGGEGQTVRYCVDCCLSKGYARYKMERGERILTFFSE